MRKYNEGYSLVMVLAVLVIIGLLATIILSFSLQNLQNQHASIDRMTAEYEAAGEIEKRIAQLEDQLAQVKTDLVMVRFADGTVSEDDRTVTYTATDAKGTCSISCTLKLIVQSMEKDSTYEDGYKVTKWTDIAVVSYDVSWGGGA